MNPVEPDKAAFVLPDGTKHTVYAKDQPEYLPLPVLKTPDGRVISQWELTEAEKIHLANGGKITLVSHTFNQPLQPIILTVGGLDLR
jgi:hypothetical protein